MNRESLEEFLKKNAGCFTIEVKRDIHRNNRYALAKLLYAIFNISEEDARSHAQKLELWKDFYTFLDHVSYNVCMKIEKSIQEDWRFEGIKIIYYESKP